MSAAGPSKNAGLQSASGGSAAASVVLAASVGAHSDLEVDGVTKRFGAHVAVQELSFAVAHGSFFSILGPSGCGKTTLLRMIAGFIAPDAGDVRIGGLSMRDVLPNRRPVNMVFQHLALFPMMSVGENVGYGLARRGVAAATIRERVASMLKRSCSSASHWSRRPAGVAINTRSAIPRACSSAITRPA